MHGYARYRRGCRCDVCREGKRQYVKMYDLGARRMVDSHPFHLAIDEAMANGASIADVVAHTGVGRHTIRDIVSGRRPVLLRSTAEKLRSVADLLEDA